MSTLLGMSHFAQDVLVGVHFAYPIVLLAFFLCAFVIQSVLAAPKDTITAVSPDIKGPGGRPLPRTRKPLSQRTAQATGFSPVTKGVLTWTSAGVTLTFLADAGIVILHSLVAREEDWWCGQHATVYIVGSFVVFGLILISLVDAELSPTWAYSSTWLLALFLEIVLLACSLAVYIPPHREPSVSDPRGGPLRQGITKWEAAAIAIRILRIVLLSTMVAIFVVFVVLRNRLEGQAKSSEASIPDETTGLLNGQGMRNGTAHTNGHTHGDAAAINQRDLWSRPDKVPSKSWFEYIRGYSLFFPYLWPSKSVRLQVIFVICVFLVMLGRVINVLSPNQFGNITDELSRGGGGIPWGGICLYIFYRFLQGGNGLISACRGALWIPISQYSYRELSTASFEHVHALSLDFHLGKKTGEVISALGKGSSINSFLEQVTFSMIPMLIDMVVAVVYFLSIYDAYYALVLFVVTLVYLYVTVRLAQWRADKRREMVNFGRQEDAVKNDSMTSYETVKYFNAEQYEFDRYRKAVEDYQGSEYTVLFSLNVMNISQNTIFITGLLVVCFIAAYQVTRGQQEVGKFVTLLTYMTQLQAPLNFFGTFYRSIQSSMINAERMLELFKEQPTVTDGPSARELTSCQGEIMFNDVQFAYDQRKPALQGVTFRCAPGTTTALVGESGGGKSTIFRLLFRFYNTDSGSIQVDGHDVHSITIDSLRQHIGVVPQDTVLFNESLMYNLKYARPSATDEEVYEACRAASIHDKILGFPDGYRAKVGERGLKLSGGEKQRVAIARTIIKNPRIILLDEATAALDSETEQHIQEALDSLAEGRTTLVIAHRLSTITTADQILVLSGGRIVESGKHEDLLQLNGKYATMWKKQIRAQKAAEEAKVLTARAERLRNEVEGDDSASQSEDERTGTGTGRRQASPSGLQTPATESEVLHGHAHHH